MTKRNKNYKNIIDVVNKIGEEIDKDLEDKIKEKYFTDTLLLYSFVENVLKWLVFNKILWNKSTRVLESQEVNIIGNVSKNLNFNICLKIAFSLDLINFKLYKKIENIKNERNSIIHQLWVYEHRNNTRLMRKKLEVISNISRELAKILTKLINKIGVDEAQNIYF